MFRHKQADTAGATGTEQRFLDEAFQEELRNHARLYFKEVLDANGESFKQSLETVTQEVSQELKTHISDQLDGNLMKVTDEIKAYATKELDTKFAGAAKVVADAQQKALSSIDEQSNALQAQYAALATRLEKSVEDQEALLTHALEENTARLGSLRAAQDQALQALTNSAGALETQYKQLADAVTTTVSKQTALMTSAFEDNMARVIEHYVLEAVGDQFDVKSQLPAILGQLESKKQTIVNDMRA